MAGAIAVRAATTKRLLPSALSRASGKISARHEMEDRSAAPAGIRRRRDTQTLAGLWDRQVGPDRAPARIIPSGFLMRCRRRKDCGGADAVASPPATAGKD